MPENKPTETIKRMPFKRTDYAKPTEKLLDFHRIFSILLNKLGNQNQEIARQLSEQGLLNIAGANPQNINKIIESLKINHNAFFDLDGKLLIEQRVQGTATGPSDRKGRIGRRFRDQQPKVKLPRTRAQEQAIERAAKRIKKRQRTQTN